MDGRPHVLNMDAHNTQQVMDLPPAALAPGRPGIPSVDTSGSTPIANGADASVCPASGSSGSADGCPAIRAPISAGRSSPSIGSVGSAQSAGDVRPVIVTSDSGASSAACPLSLDSKGSIGGKPDEAVADAISRRTSAVSGPLDGGSSEQLQWPLVFFFDAFYTQLFTLAPEVRPLFRSSLKTQGRALVMMLDTAVHLLDQADALTGKLEGLARRHVAYGAVPAHFGVVGECLLHALGTSLGEHFTPEVRHAWLVAYSLMMSVMMRIYSDEKEVARLQGEARALQLQLQLEEKRREEEASAAGVHTRSEDGRASGSSVGGSSAASGHSRGESVGDGADSLVEVIRV